MWIFSAIANAVGRNFIGRPNYLFDLLFNRAQADGGVTEAQQCTINELTDLQNDNLLSSASLVLTPSSYKEGKLYSVIPTNGNGDLTFTRATTATRVNSAGLVELVPYNLLQRSEDFENAYWSKNDGAIAANNTTAPNGTTTADKFTASANNSYHYVNLFTALTVSGSNTFSFYVKKSTATWIFFTFRDSAINYFNLDTGAFGTTPDTCTSQNVGNGWYRITVNKTDTVANCGIGVASGNGGAQFLAAGTEAIFIWGAQLNEGTNALTYQKTETRLNIPRLDYSLGGCPNILLEPQRTNIIARSEEFNTWLLYEYSSIATNTAISPNVTLSADTLISGVTLGRQEVYKSPNTAYVNGTVYTISVYAKSNGKTWIYLGTNINEAVFFNIVNGTIGSSTSLWSGTISSLGNGWYRCTATFTYGSLASANQIIIGNASANGVYSDSGNGVLGTYLWGAQIETGAYATSYIPTTSTSITRNADEMVVSNLQSNSILSSTGLTYFMEFSKRNLPSADAYPRLENLTGNDIIGISTNSTELIASIRIGGGSFVNTPILSAYNNQLVKVAFSLSGTTLKIFVNGSLALTTTASASSIYERLDVKTTLDKDQRYKQIALWKTPLTDDQLEALTSEGFDTYAAMASYYNYTLQ